MQNTPIALKPQASLHKIKFKNAINQTILSNKLAYMYVTTYLRLAPEADLSLEVHAAYSPMASATIAKSPRKK